MKILLSAYSCLPTQTSEPGNAWRAINHALANNHEIWAVIEQSLHEKRTREYLAQHPMPGFHPIFLGMPPILVKTCCTAGMLHSVYYHLWQRKLMGLASQLHRDIHFDLTHHVTYGRYWSPSGVRHLGIPFLWGPVGAAEFTPPAFLAELPWRARLFEGTRDTVRRLNEKSRALHQTAAAATIGIGVTRETCAALRKLGVKRVEQLPQASLSDEDMNRFAQLPSPPAGPFRAICIGRHIHWKGFHLAIRAFAIFAKKNPDAELWILNNGPFRAELEKTAAETGVSNRVRFTGVLPSYNDVLKKLGESHVLMHPALHEAFGNVCYEALAAGRPVVCLDLGGPATQATNETGFVAPADNPTESVQAMAGFLDKIANNRDLLAKMSANARARAREKFSMRALGSAIEAFYHEAVALHAQRR